jgi:SpoVK/Ycf46/Vps4 family AAA+-type ATPase
LAHSSPILQVHARNKPIDRSGDDALLRQIADLAIGFSGAELANLLNEGAILAVSTHLMRASVPGPCRCAWLPRKRLLRAVWLERLRWRVLLLCWLHALMSGELLKDVLNCELASLAPCPAQVRKNNLDSEGKPVIDLPILKEAMDKVRGAGWAVTNPQWLAGRLEAGWHALACASLCRWLVVRRLHGQGRLP